MAHRGSRPKFMKPGDDGNVREDGWRNASACLEDRIPAHSDAAGTSNATLVFNNPYAALSLQQQRNRLPIFKNRNHILYLLEQYQTLVVVGETGCGKSTQLPQYLLESGWCSDGRKVGVTQPRRVAAVTLANRVAEECMCLVGQTVGYVVRFDDCSNENTKIKFMTDGILLREIMSDPLLTSYSVIMVDEAHERGMNTDLIVGLLRKIIIKRKDLRVVISSATLDAELFRDFFNLNETNDKTKDTSSIISVEGRMYPVDVLFAKNSFPNYLKAAVDCVMRIHKNEDHGDILTFLTGQDEVEAVCEMLRNQIKTMRNVDKMWILPMYGGLPAKEQFRVFDSTPAGTRKVVVATNVAETSVTISGIVYVIDSGFVKIRALNDRTAIESLIIVPISQASAEQRAGRAGRVRPGKAYRLYPESEFLKLSKQGVPEMQRSHLSGVILQLKALGIENVVKFHFISRPPSFSMIRGVELLYALGALDDNGGMTQDVGMKIAEMPLPPMHAKALLASGEFECSEEMVTIISMLQIQDVFMFPKGQRHKAEVMKRRFSVEEGDHLTFLNIFTNFVKHGCSKQWCGQHFVNYRGLCRAVNIRNQLVNILKRYNIPIIGCDGDTRLIRKALVSGFFSNAARLHYTGVYRTVREDYTLKVHKGSAIMYREQYPEWVIFNEVLQDSMRDVTVIDPEWLYTLAPHYYEFGTEFELLSKKARTK